MASRILGLEKEFRWGTTFTASPPTTLSALKPIIPTLDKPI